MVAVLTPPDQITPTLLPSQQEAYNQTTEALSDILGEDVSHHLDASQPLQTILQFQVGGEKTAHEQDKLFKAVVQDVQFAWTQGVWDPNLLPAILMRHMPADQHALVQGKAQRLSSDYGDLTKVNYQFPDHYKPYIDALVKKLNSVAGYTASRENSQINVTVSAIPDAEKLRHIFDEFSAGITVDMTADLKPSAVAADMVNTLQTSLPLGQLYFAPSKDRPHKNNILYHMQVPLKELPDTVVEYLRNTPEAIERIESIWPVSIVDHPKDGGLSLALPVFANTKFYVTQKGKEDNQRKFSGEQSKIIQALDAVFTQLSQQEKPDMNAVHIEEGYVKLSADKESARNAAQFLEKFRPAPPLDNAYKNLANSLSKFGIDLQWKSIERPTYKTDRRALAPIIHEALTEIQLAYTNQDLDTKRIDDITAKLEQKIKSEKEFIAPKFPVFASNLMLHQVQAALNKAGLDNYVTLKGQKSGVQFLAYTQDDRQALDTILQPIIQQKKEHEEQLTLIEEQIEGAENYLRQLRQLQAPDQKNALLSAVQDLPALVTLNEQAKKALTQQIEQAKQRRQDVQNAVSDPAITQSLQQKLETVTWSETTKVQVRLQRQRAQKFTAHLQNVQGDISANRFAIYQNLFAGMEKRLPVKVQIHKNGNHLATIKAGREDLANQIQGQFDQFNAALKALNLGKAHHDQDRQSLENLFAQYIAKPLYPKSSLSYARNLAYIRPTSGDVLDRVVSHRDVTVPLEQAGLIMAQAQSSAPFVSAINQALSPYYAQVRIDNAPGQEATMVLSVPTFATPRGGENGADQALQQMLESALYSANNALENSADIKTLDVNAHMQSTFEQHVKTLRSAKPLAQHGIPTTAEQAVDLRRLSDAKTDDYIPQADITAMVQATLKSGEAVFLSDVADAYQLDISHPEIHAALISRLESMTQDPVLGRQIALSQGDSFIFTRPDAFEGDVEFSVQGRKGSWTLTPVKWDGARYGVAPVQRFTGDEDHKTYGFQDGDTIQFKVKTDPDSPDGTVMDYIPPKASEKNISAAKLRRGVRAQQAAEMPGGYSPSHTRKTELSLSVAEKIHEVISQKAREDFQDYELKADDKDLYSALMDGNFADLDTAAAPVQKQFDKKRFKHLWDQGDLKALNDALETYQARLNKQGANWQLSMLGFGDDRLAEAYYYPEMLDAGLKATEIVMQHSKDADVKQAFLQGCHTYSMVIASQKTDIAPTANDKPLPYPLRATLQKIPNDDLIASLPQGLPANNKHAMTLILKNLGAYNHEVGDQEARDILEQRLNDLSHDIRVRKVMTLSAPEGGVPDQHSLYMRLNSISDDDLLSVLPKKGGDKVLKNNVLRALGAYEEELNDPALLQAIKNRLVIMGIAKVEDGQFSLIYDGGADLTAIEEPAVKTFDTSPEFYHQLQVVNHGAYISDSQILASISDILEKTDADKLGPFVISSAEILQALGADNINATDQRMRNAIQNRIESIANHPQTGRNIAVISLDPLCVRQPHPFEGPVKFSVKGSPGKRTLSADDWDQSVYGIAPSLPISAEQDTGIKEGESLTCFVKTDPKSGDMKVQASQSQTNTSAQHVLAAVIAGESFINQVAQKSPSVKEQIQKRKALKALLNGQSAPADKGEHVKPESDEIQEMPIAEFASSLTTAFQEVSGGKPCSVKMDPDNDQKLLVEIPSGSYSDFSKAFNQVVKLAEEQYQSIDHISSTVQQRPASEIIPPDQPV